MSSNSYCVQIGQFGFAFASNVLADCIARANELANVGRKAVVRQSSNGAVVYRNWTPSAGTTEGRAILSR